MSSDFHVYRLNWLRLWVLPIMWLIVTAVLLALGVTGEEPRDRAAGFGTAAIITLIFGLMFYFMVWKSHLELDERGITHFQFGYTVHSSWDNLESISMSAGAEGLYLREPGTNSFLLRASTRPLKSASRVVGLSSVVGDYDALAQGRFIALMPFSSRLHGGPLSRDLERWAPHLFRAG